MLKYKDYSKLINRIHRLNHLSIYRMQISESFHLGYQKSSVTHHCGEQGFTLLKEQDESTEVYTRLSNVEPCLSTNIQASTGRDLTKSELKEKVVNTQVHADLRRTPNLQKKIDRDVLL